MITLDFTVAMWGFVLGLFCGSVCSLISILVSSLAKIMSGR